MDTISPLEMAWRTSCEWHLSTMRKWCKDLINRWSSNIWSIDSSLLAVWKAFKNLRLLGITSLFGKNPNKRGRWIQAILTSPSRRKHPKIAWEGADSSPFPKHFVGTDIPYQLPNPYQLVSRKIRVARLLSLQDGRCANILFLSGCWLYQSSKEHAWKTMTHTTHQPQTDWCFSKNLICSVCWRFWRFQSMRIHRRGPRIPWKNMSDIRMDFVITLYPPVYLTYSKLM